MQHCSWSSRAEVRLLCGAGERVQLGSSDSLSTVKVCSYLTRRGQRAGHSYTSWPDSTSASWLLIKNRRCGSSAFRAIQRYCFINSVHSFQEINGEVKVHFACMAMIQLNGGLSTILHLRYSTLSFFFTMSVRFDRSTVDKLLFLNPWTTVSMGFIKCKAATYPGSF